MEGQMRMQMKMMLLRMLLMLLQLPAAAAEDNEGLDAAAAAAVFAQQPLKPSWRWCWLRWRPSTPGAVVSHSHSTWGFLSRTCGRDDGRMCGGQPLCHCRLYLYLYLIL